MWSRRWRLLPSSADLRGTSEDSCVFPLILIAGSRRSPRRAAGQNLYAEQDQSSNGAQRGPIPQDRDRENTCRSHNEAQRVKS